MPKLSDIIEKLPKGWHKPQQSNMQKAKQRKPKKSNYQRVMEQIGRIGANGLFSMMKGVILLIEYIVGIQMVVQMS